ncbi:MAG: NAD(P)H-dependent oxidoreductase subunit E [Saprospiraceae bacterium]|nr:NAD(P)H-dependent oxidoreductase subunit E [Saprospiraceae bacterium]MCF8249385.1 NAD(P)H-dependent oxidoreductase subunit E [Saprospiraceae bacterium]MCF8279039.1 NAD(P)H-dependent oxidoreductase subunit E [Bacteroidales bacterium]MCF8311514.1 NAD(P)H-dependent oxidoreductase subunit E [Saprospiraceae bacterium]MCF8440004.1 NAD(P)H-dependent oxidoreductase subunit E [Saprospiraceae bacterium]
MSKNLTALSGRKGLTDNLFETIGNLTEAEGFLNNKDAARLAEEYLVGDAAVYGASTFYDFTRPENKGKKVYVCNGSACLVAGTQDKLKAELGQHFKAEEIGEMTCLGRCHENSAFHYDGHNYSGQSTAKLQLGGNIAELEFGDTYNVQAIGAGILTKPFASLDEIRDDFKKMLAATPEDLLAQIKASGLRGRGGAGFPIGIKLEGCRKAESDQKYIVCNADEGDPGSYSDRYLLEQQPIAVLVGLIIAGYVTGADRGVMYIRYEYPESIEIIKQAIADLAAAGLTGTGILGSDFNFEFKVIEARGAYICGEETALLASIEGQRPEVRVRPPYPVNYGLFGKPTIVNNVETLANLHFILKNGGEAFAKIGTSKSSGTKLISLDSAFNCPGIYEVDMGTPLATVVEELGGGFKRPVKALHIGGPLGGLVPVEKMFDLTVDFESFAQNSFLLGHASIVSLPEEYPMVAYLEHLFAFTAHESCGKCFPCRIGSVRGKELLQKAQTSDYKIDNELFTDLLDTMKKGSLCALGGGIPLPVMNAMAHFGGELSAYFKEKV